MPKLFSNVFGYASTLSGWIRPSKVDPIVTVLRTVRDVEADESRCFSEIYIPGSGGFDGFQALIQLPSSSVPATKPILHGVSKSGSRTVSFTQGRFSTISPIHIPICSLLLDSPTTTTT